jgi:hypothetical protein
MEMPSSLLSTIANQLKLYGYPIFAILGNIGNVFIAILFRRQGQNACAIYIISSAIGNSLNLIYSYIIQLIIVDYSDETLNQLVQCKILNYSQNVIGQIPKTMIILACIDRFLITDNRATWRALSTPKRAKWLCFFSIIFWFLFDIHIPIMQRIINGKCVQVGIYSTIYRAYLIVFVGSLPTITMVIFGYLTYRNMKTLRVRVQPIGHDRIVVNNTIRRLDRDLLIIVISELLVYVGTTGLFSLTLLEMMISGYVRPNKSVQYLQIEIFIVTIAAFLLYVNSGIPFYIYLVSSKSFCRDFKQLIINGYRKLRRQPTIVRVSRANQTLAQRDTRV